MKTSLKSKNRLANTSLFGSCGVTKSNPEIVCTPAPGITPEKARDARARAWAYVFDCFNRRNGKEGGPAKTAPDAAKENKDVRDARIISNRS